MRRRAMVEAGKPGLLDVVWALAYATAIQSD